MIHISNVGVNGDAIKRNGRYVVGTGTVYSTDTGTIWGFEYTDDFNFTYDVSDGLTIISDLDDKEFGDHIEYIECLLIDNLKTNFKNLLKN